jgi:hypothetical protein
MPPERFQPKNDERGKALESSFTAREDAELAATMMVMALGYELGQPATEADQLRYRAALERLPKGSTATPRLVFVSPYDQNTDPHWRVTFTVGPMRYESSRRFVSVAEAETYTTDFLARLRDRSISAAPKNIRGHADRSKLPC